MTTEEKLNHFKAVVIDEARGQSLKALNEHRKILETLFSEHKEEKNRQADLQIKTETHRLERQNNVELSKERINIKRGISAKHEELKEMLFVEVQQKLTDFMNTREYQDLLIRQIKDILKYANGEQVSIYIDPADASHLTALQVAVNHPLLLSSQTFKGGTKAVIPARHILIDNSFATRLSEAKKTFSFGGGALHD